MAPLDSPPPDQSPGPLPGGTAGPPDPARASAHRRRRGALLTLGSLVAIGVVILIVVLVSDGGDSHPSSSSSSTLAVSPATSTASASPAPGRSTRTSSTASTQIVAQITLMAPHDDGRASGIAEILRQGGAHAIAIVAQGLARNRGEPPDAYAVWLYNSPRNSRILGLADPGVAGDGRLQTTGKLPADASRYRKVVLTLETKAQPRRPGRIVLSGTLTGLHQPRG
jgi:hypothetical protein